MIEGGIKRPAEQEIIGPNPAKLRKLNYQDLLLQNLPSAESYELSYMHKDTVNHILTSTKVEVIITCSIDGHIKFWKKVFHLIEFVKNFKVHTGLITGLSFSRSHQLLCSVGIDRTLKIFDVPTCDLRTIIKLSFAPSCCEFIPQNTFDWQTIAIAQEKASKIHIIDPEGNELRKAVTNDKEIDINWGGDKKEEKKQENACIIETLTFHKHPIKAMKMNWSLGVCFSIDERAFLEVWDALTYDFPKKLQYKKKIDTEFLSLLQANSPPLSISLSPNGSYLGVLLKDRIIRVFNCRTGKRVCTIDESLKQVVKIQEDNTNIYHSQCVYGEAEFDKKLALQKDIQIAKEYLQNSNIEFDEAQQYIIYPSFQGIKIYSLKTGQLERILGKRQNERFIRVAVYQGQAMRNPAGSSTMHGERKAADPTIFCTAFKRARFYIFSKRLTEANAEGGLLRDIVNERTSKEEQQVTVPIKPQQTLNEVVLQTTFGDIHILLYMEECPKTCENFIKLTRKGYYNGMVFHRVVKGFMNQTGCPKGDGTGGESIWGGNFEDELVPQKLRFDKPYLVAMANRGANTNGSQFFITVVACPWLDNKHTLFGRVIKGIETVCDINKLKTDKLDRPIMAVKIMNARIIGDNV